MKKRGKYRIVLEQGEAKKLIWEMTEEERTELSRIHFEKVKKEYEKAGISWGAYLDTRRDD